MGKLTLILGAGALLLGLSFHRAGGAPPIDFKRDIQPILAANCAPCHFGDNAKGNLRLDSRQDTLRVIVAGRAAESKLIQRLNGEGELKRMPLGREPLTAAQISIIKQWIDEGASWPAASEPAQSRHWAFVPVSRPGIPAVAAKAWVRNPIDSFILARLEKEGLTPSPEADRVTLLRRLSLDLIGLPPTPQEIDSFVNDKSPNAYEKQVDRLLASPHYGEKWGRQWLDAARYADSDGFEKDKSRSVWYYRDWVINSLNQDKPYDRFVIEQIAGDLLPNATQEQRVATGFLRNSMINEEGGVDPEQFRMEAMFDRMDAIGKSVLGFTINCAQCHNHKYDPISQEDYYRMFAFLNNSHEGSIAVYTAAELRKQGNILSQTAEIEAALREKTPGWEARMEAWENEVKTNQPAWTVIRPTVDDISTGGQRYIPLEDGSFLAQGYAPTKHQVKLSWKAELSGITAVRLELLNDPNLPLSGPGRSIKGTSALTEFSVETSTEAKPKETHRLKIQSATADINPAPRELEALFDDKSGRRRIEGPVEFAIDGNDDTAWGIDAGPGLRNQSRKAVFQLETPVGDKGTTVFNFLLKQNHGGWNSNDNQNKNLGRFRLSVTTAKDAVADPLPQAVRDILSIPRQNRTKAQVNRLFSYWRSTVPEFKAENQKIQALWNEYPEGDSQLVLSERDIRRDTYTLKRGDFLRPDRKIGAGVPSFLNPLPAGAPESRLTFAKWMVDRSSPTTPRALVNRLWQALFGTGIYSTLEDIGKQSEVPSHRELLDWLAVELMEPTTGAGSSKPWSIKHVLKLIVTSATYRQSSVVSPRLKEKDPFNRLLARGPRVRVDAEIVRDIALSASGLLNPVVGGPSVFPPSPEFLYLPPASYGTKTWVEEKGPNRYRRALYTFRFRSVPFPALQAFDAPNGDISCVRRARSNTPLQALVTLNEPLFLEAARALAVKTLTEGGETDEARLIFAFRRVLGRSPGPDEKKELLGIFSRQRQRFTSGALNPWNFAVNDPDKPFLLPRGRTMDELASWTAVARVLLNLDEAITKE